jgi:hypothetical protein
MKSTNMTAVTHAEGSACLSSNLTQHDPGVSLVPEDLETD